MTTFTDSLPETKSSKSGMIFFQPAETSPTPAGVLSVRTDRNWSQYAVVAFAADGGRGFHFAKIEGGTDAESDTYAVFCSATNPHADICDCKGFTYRHTCKHRDSARAIVANGWL